MRILIIDDHPVFVLGLSALLSEMEAGCEIVSASFLAAALASYPSEIFGLVLLDMNLPGTSNMEALRAVLPVYPSAPVVVISANVDRALIYEALDAGAFGYIPKSMEPAPMKRALQLVLDGGSYLPAILLEGIAPGNGRERCPSLPRFTERQEEVLVRMIRGKPNKTIANELDIAEGTVKAHLDKIYTALDVHNRGEAIYRCNQLGISGPLRPALPRR